jgi:hypothetical protein
MDYVVSRRQIKDLAFKYFDRIWGDVLPKVGKNYTYVFADSTGRGRIGFNKSIQYDRAYLILEDDCFPTLDFQKLYFFRLFNFQIFLRSINSMFKRKSERSYHHRGFQT